MLKIEPLLEDLLRLFYQLKIAADNKTYTGSGLIELENVFKRLSETANSYNSENKHIINYLKTIDDISKRKVIKYMSALRNENYDFFDEIEYSFSKYKRFDYKAWGIMNKRIQQYYIRIYTSYSKCIYELIKSEL